MNKNKNKEKILNIRIYRTIEQDLKTIAKLEQRTVSAIAREFLNQGIINYCISERNNNNNDISKN